MRLSNKDVLVVLKEALAAMEIKGYNFFKVRAYQNAISILDNLTVSIYDLLENKRLQEIPGLGEGLIGHLTELFKEGQVKEFEHLKKDLPQGMFGLIGLRGIGAKKAYKLAMAFKLTDKEEAIEKIRDVAQKGKIQVLEGFGEKSEKMILEAIEQEKQSKNTKPRMLYVKAEEIVQRLTDYMKLCPEVTELEAAGSFRRKNATIGDLDMPVATNDPEKVLVHFLKYPEITEVVVQGDKKATVIVNSDVQVDIRVSTPEAYGAMLQYFTGSKQHNIVLRNFAITKKLSLSEYGIKKNEKILEFSNEKVFYDYLGLQYIPPEIRHGGNEVELAAKNAIPKLIEESEIKGDVHVHTTDSDGTNTIFEMAELAISKGYEYLGITDHAPSVLVHGEGTVLKAVSEKRKLINEINTKQTNLKILFGYEVNILADATLGLPDIILKELDYCIASIHTSFNQDRDTMTKRLLAAIENPYVDIIGHPSGRLLNERDPADPDWSKVFAAVRDHNKLLEINSQPNRLDLTDDLIKMAKEWGVKFVITSDAHSQAQMASIRYGIYNARRGFAVKSDILNTLPYKEFVKYLRVR
jgi:DNA polymerase (family 10)